MALHGCSATTLLGNSLGVQAGSATTDNAGNATVVFPNAFPAGSSVAVTMALQLAAASPAAFQMVLVGAPTTTQFIAHLDLYGLTTGNESATHTHPIGIANSAGGVQVRVTTGLPDFFNETGGSNTVPTGNESATHTHALPVTPIPAGLTFTWVAVAYL